MKLIILIFQRLKRIRKLILCKKPDKLLRLAFVKYFPLPNFFLTSPKGELVCSLQFSHLNPPTKLCLQVTNASLNF